MRRKFQIAATLTWAIFVAAMVGIVASWPGRSRELIYTDAGAATAGAAGVIHDDDFSAMTAPAFSLIDQNRSPVTSESLKGQPYVAILFFTKCEGPCPSMIGRMLALQNTVPDSRVKLVSFTVDPERDTPAVLKQYADARGCDAARWHFLTGQVDAMVKVARGLNLGFIPGSAETPLQHDSKFVLVDADGMIKGHYDTAKEAQMKQLTRDAALLVR